MNLIYILIVVGILFGYTKVKKFKKKKENLSSMLWYELWSYHYKYMDNGYIPVFALILSWRLIQLVQVMLDTVFFETSYLIVVIAVNCIWF